VPEAVEVQPGGESGLEDGRLEVAAVEVPLPDGAALGHGEHVSVEGRVPPDVLAEHLGEEAGEGEGPGPAGLGGAGDQLAADLHHRLGDVDGAGQEVEGRHPQGGELAGPHAGVGGGVDEGGEPGGDGLGQGGDLVGGEEVRLLALAVGRWLPGRRPGWRSGRCP
jgi:hypothetical protein